VLRGFASVVQAIRADLYRGRRVRFSGYLKGLETGKLAALWLRVDGAGHSLEFGNTTKPLSTDWLKYEVVLDVPEDGLTINFGFILNSGQLWADDFRLEIVDRDVPVTGNPGQRERYLQEFMKKPEAERKQLESRARESAKKLPLKPVNLDFEP
jgi:hypothetical protein